VVSLTFAEVTAGFYTATWDVPADTANGTFVVDVDGQLSLLDGSEEVVPRSARGMGTDLHHRHHSQPLIKTNASIVAVILFLLAPPSCSKNFDKHF